MTGRVVKAESFCDKMRPRQGRTKGVAALGKSLGACRSPVMGYLSGMQDVLAGREAGVAHASALLRLEGFGQGVKQVDVLSSTADVTNLLCAVPGISSLVGQLYVVSCTALAAFDRRCVWQSCRQLC